LATATEQTTPVSHPSLDKGDQTLAVPKNSNENTTITILHHIIRSIMVLHK